MDKQTHTHIQSDDLPLDEHTWGSLTLTPISLVGVYISAKGFHTSVSLVPRPLPVLQHFMRIVGGPGR